MNTFGIIFCNGDNEVWETPHSLSYDAAVRLAQQCIEANSVKGVDLELGMLCSRNDNFNLTTAVITEDNSDNEVAIVQRRAGKLTVRSVGVIQRESIEKFATETFNAIVHRLFSNTQPQAVSAILAERFDAKARAHGKRGEAPEEALCGALSSYYSALCTRAPKDGA